MPLLSPEQKQKLRQLAVLALKIVIPLVLGGIGGNQLTPPKTVEVEKLIPAPPPPIVPLDEFTPTQGWVKDDAAIAANLDPVKTTQFDQTPAGRAVMGDDDVFLWQAVRKVNNRGPPWYPNVNQGSIGCCVGAGFKHGCDIVQATAILSGKPFEWKPVSVEVIYGGSRVEVGGGRISGDGSVGAWAAKWLVDYGVVPMARYDAADLTTFSPQRAREFGRAGVPAAIEQLAKSHPVKGTALVKSWADAKRAIAQGYPVAVCSDQGFTMARDATGRARPQGSWAHCMCVCGIRSATDGRAEGGFVLNSWGDQAHTGPVWPADAPVAGFWADAGVLDRMFRQNDSFALSDVAGFPTRKIDWFVEARPRDPRADLFAHFKPEVALSW